jgi:hypothetical protein
MSTVREGGAPETGTQPGTAQAHPPQTLSSDRPIKVYILPCVAVYQAITVRSGPVTIWVSGQTARPPFIACITGMQ